MIGPERVGEAAVVVSIDEAKAHVRLDFDETETAQETELLALIAAATEIISKQTGLVLGEETWRFSVGPQVGRLLIPVSPVRSVTTIAYLDQDRAEATATVSDFLLIKDYDRPYLVPFNSAPWPKTTIEDDAITITLLAGLAAPLPSAIRVAILMMVDHFYQHRGTVFAGTINELPLTVRSLIEPYRRTWVAA